MRPTRMRALPALLLTLAVGAALTGCDPATPAPVRAPPSLPPSPTTERGWAEQVVPAGGAAAYVAGRDARGATTLWAIDPAGHLSRRHGPAGRGRIADLVFSGGRTGLAIRGRATLSATDDGARTWRVVRPPTPERPVRVAVGGGAAYALTSNCPRPTAACDHATLWSVDPSGVAAPHTFGTLPSHAGTDGPIGLAADGDTVWVLLGMGAGEGAALRSTDGGRTWSRATVGGCLWEDLVPTSSTVLWSTCGTGMMMHFARQSGAAAPREVLGHEVGGTTDSVLAPLTDTTAYAVIDDRRGTRVEVTHDGGRTTATVAPIPRPIARRGFEATFVSERIGYLVTDNGGQLYRSDDGARTWAEVSAPTS